MTTNFEDLCVTCQKETPDLEYCCNAGCDNYICNSCYTRMDNDIVCPDCIGNCICCNEVININDIEKNSNISCKRCNTDKIYCEKCIKIYHLSSCNFYVCHICVDSCISCYKISCCNKIYGSTFMCEQCIIIHLKESREYLLTDLLTSHTTFCNDVINLIKQYWN